MNRTRRTLTMLLLTAITLAMAPSLMQATSNVPEPGAFGIPINPNASGTKLSGPVSIAYDIEPDAATCPSGRRVFNMFVVLTVQQGNNIKPFNRALNPAPEGFCFPGNTNQQVALFLGLIADEVIPFFFQCTPGVNCPAFQVKAITDFLSTSNGAMSLNLTLAVQ